MMNNDAKSLEINYNRRRLNINQCKSNPNHENAWRSTPNPLKTEEVANGRIQIEAEAFNNSP